jgi:hypothetical protein
VNAQLDFASEAWADACLDDALVRLDQVFARARTGGATGSSFSIGDASPEFQLLEELEQPASETNARQFFEGLLAQARGAIPVETEHEGQLVAKTTVGLGGDVVTLLVHSAAPETFERHRQRVATALETRRVRLKIVLTTLEVAAQIALVTGTGNPLVALRAAWRFVLGVQDQWQRRATPTT